MNCIAKLLLPIPGVPVTMVMEPSGNPPPVISSTPGIPVLTLLLILRHKELLFETQIIPPYLLESSCSAILALSCEIYYQHCQDYSYHYYIRQIICRFSQYIEDCILWWS